MVIFVKKRNLRWIYFIISVIVILGIVLWYKRPIIFEESRNTIKSWINNTASIEGYNGKSLIVVDRKHDDIFISKKENEKQLPASLSKLFVIEYAISMCKLDEKVLVKKDVLKLVKQGSSVTGLKGKRYSIQNIFAAMLVPSGNDAAYILADYLGGKLNSAANTPQKRIRAFVDGLNTYLKNKGYKSTKLYDPSGFDLKSYTTVLDVKKCVDNLLKYPWFRNIISQSYYVATLPDGSKQNWKNTNMFLDKNSKHFKEGVIGIKTGSLGKDYNLVVLYKKHGKEFLICSLGSDSDTARYDDVFYILKTIDESSSLKK